MKMCLIPVAVLLFTVFAFSAAAQEKPTGDEIAAMMMNWRKSIGGFVGKGAMDVVDLAVNKTDSRNFTMIISVIKDDISTIFRFTDPRLKMATFLSIDRKGKDPELYMYFNTFKQPLQIRARQNQNNFLDTDISSEDLGTMDMDDYTYKRMTDVSCPVDGRKRDCYFIERYPRTKSVYSKQVVLIDREWLLPVVCKSYNDAGRIVKQLTAGDIRKINEKVYMPFSIKIVNLEMKRETNVKFTSIIQQKVNINVDMMTRSWTE